MLLLDKRTLVLSTTCTELPEAVHLESACVDGADVLAAAGSVTGPAQEQVCGRAARLLRARCFGGVLGMSAPPHALKSVSIKKCQLWGVQSMHQAMPCNMQPCSALPLPASCTVTQAQMAVGSV